MRTGPIVALDVVGQGLGPLRLAFSGPPVPPLLGKRPVHPLDLPVPPRAVGASAPATQPGHGGEREGREQHQASGLAHALLGAEQRGPCVRMLGHGMAPFAASPGNSQHAEAIPFCHHLDTYNVLAHNSQPTFAFVKPAMDNTRVHMSPYG